MHTLHDRANPRNKIHLITRPAAAVPSPPSKWKRHFERGTPEEALTWKTAKQRAARMFEWRCAVMEKFSSSARVLRVAWLLDCLCWKEGYAFPADSYISKTLGLQLNNLQAALTELERAGAVIRASSFVNGKPQRRIWPSTKIIPLMARGMDAPYGDSQDTPHREGTDSIITTQARRTRRISTTAEAAKRDAEQRERRRGTASSGQQVNNERRAPQAPRRPADDAIEGEIIDGGGVAGAPPPDQLQRAMARALDIERQRDAHQ